MIVSQTAMMIRRMEAIEAVTSLLFCYSSDSFN